MMNLIYATCYIVGAIFWGLNANFAAKERRPILFAIYVLCGIASTFTGLYYLKQ